MIIDIQNKIGYFDNECSFNTLGLIAYDFSTGNKEEFSAFKDYKLGNVSSNKKYLAVLRDCTFRGNNKKEIVVFDKESEEVIFTTKDYYAYDVKFNNTGNKLFVDAYNWSSAIFSSETGNLLCLSAPETADNSWGADFVIDAETGTIIKRIEGMKGAGKLACNYFGNKLLTYTGTTLDMETGKYSIDPII
ncbi:hypothetical protein ACI6Q2_12645 [Chitinophagaceae bacterium LWZ2-11]